MTNKEIFAIDVGGVLASKQHDGEPLEGSLEAIKILSCKYLLRIVSMCGKNREYETKKWLHKNGFQDYIPITHQIYIRFNERNKNRILQAINAKYFIAESCGA